MNESFKAVHRSHESTGLSDVKRFGYENAKKVQAFHASFPEYTPTPLVNLGGLAGELGLGSVYVKDESYRFGLNAFKVLGGSYAIGSYIAGRLGMDISELPYEKLVSDEVRAKLGEITFVTATDGNHGRGVAWTANRLKQKAVVYMPQGSALERLHNIQALGADASITDLNYDDAVRLANEGAEKYGWVMVQDTAWEGYEDIPAWIMQGYTTMALEAVQQLEQIRAQRPTHIFLQAGVGALSGGLTGFFADLYGDESGPSSPSWSPTRRTASTAPPRPTTASCTSSPAGWTPSWRALPAASPAPSAGRSCGTTPTTSSPARTMWRPRACACWATPCRATSGSFPARAARPPWALWRKSCRTRAWTGCVRRCS